MHACTTTAYSAKRTAIHHDTAGHSGFDPSPKGYAAQARHDPAARTGGVHCQVLHLEGAVWTPRVKSAAQIRLQAADVCPSAHFLGRILTSSAHVLRDIMQCITRGKYAT